MPSLCDPTRPSTNTTCGLLPVTSALEQKGGYEDAALDRVRDAVAVLEAVVHVRNARQHGGGQEKGAAAVKTLGLSYPIFNPSYAWQVIQNKVIAALTALREEIR